MGPQIARRLHQAGGDVIAAGTRKTIRFCNPLECGSDLAEIREVQAADDLDRDRICLQDAFDPEIGQRRARRNGNELPVLRQYGHNERAIASGR